MSIDSTSWQQIDVGHWTELFTEQQGSEGAAWLLDDSGEESNQARWLHKDTVMTTKAAHEQGEDWSEVISTQVAALLGVPAAEARLCVRHGRRGSVSRSVVPDGWSLIDGSTRLQTCPEVEGYVPHLEGQPAMRAGDPRLRRPGHTLTNIKAALRTVAPPPGFTGPSELEGFDVFVGYLLLDALVANRDRHEQNWAVLQPGLGAEPTRLSPSFDHASSLGFQLTDAKRSTILADVDGLVRFAERGTAWRFEHRGKDAPTLVALAAQGLRLCSSAAAGYWRTRLRGLDLQPLTEPIMEGDIVTMSAVAATFVTELLQLNARRLRHAAFGTS